MQWGASWPSSSLQDQVREHFFSFLLLSHVFCKLLRESDISVLPILTERKLQLQKKCFKCVNWLSLQAFILAKGGNHLCCLILKPAWSGVCRSGNDHGSRSWKASRGMWILRGMINNKTTLKPREKKKKDNFHSFCAVTKPTWNLIGVACQWKNSCQCSSLLCVCVTKTLGSGWRVFFKAFPKFCGLVWCELEDPLHLQKQGGNYFSPVHLTGRAYACDPLPVLLAKHICTQSMIDSSAKLHRHG